MIDSHIHIGQFEDIWYDPLEITQIVLEVGHNARQDGGFVFSSTTSCVENICYAQVEAEIDALLAKINLQQNNIHPLLWYAPHYAAQGVDIANAMNNLPYSGFKIHPRAHDWNQDDPKIVSILHKIFSYAEEKCLPVLIHTGYDSMDAADVFSRFFDIYSNVNFILSHCRPSHITLNLLSTHTNIYCDTAFVDDKILKNIIKHGFSKKILLGSDFPITHYFSHKYSKYSSNNDVISWKNQYKKDNTILNRHNHLINSNKIHFDALVGEII